MMVQETEARSTLYGGLANSILNLIQSGTFREGQRIPSIRAMSRQFGVSVNTVREAYWVLETRRILEGRPQSGYFVRRRGLALPHATDDGGDQLLNPRGVLACSLRSLSPEVLKDAPYRAFDLIRAAPDASLFPTAKLNGFLGAVAREAGEDLMNYDSPRGDPALRTQVARISLEAGIRLAPDDYLITSGCIPSIALAVKVLCRAGDTVAVESPCYGPFLQLFQQLGLRVLEIPTSPDLGLNLEVLEWVLERHEVKAVLVIPTFNNPVGFSMPDHRKKALVELITRKGVPLIEDDAYGELSFVEQRPPACKAFDNEGMVIYCSSISKTLSPGYRVGWVAGGRWHEALVDFRTLEGSSAAQPVQKALARYFEHGNYARHLRALRRQLAIQSGAVADAVAESFPEGTRMTRPLGGLFLWLELPENVDTEALYPVAAAEGVFYRAGVVFSASGKFQNHLRLGTGTWNAELERAVRRLGELTRR